MPSLHHQMAVAGRQSDAGAIGPDAICYDFCRSGFGQFDNESYTGHEEVTFTEQDDLPQNDIHPIFAESNIAGLEPDDYSGILDLPLRLASRCLTSDAFVRYVMVLREGQAYLPAVNAKIVRHGHKLNLDDLQDVYRRDEDGELTFPQEDLDDKGLGAHPWDQSVMIFPRKSHTKVSDDHRRAVKKAMDALTNMVSISVTHKPDKATPDDADDEHGGVTLGHCSWTYGPLQEHQASCFPRGRVSLIGLNPDEIHGLRYLQANEPGSVRPTLRYKQFQLASTLLHELGHAIHNAAVGRMYSEAFYANRLCSEQSFEMEQQLFGGLISREAFYWAEAKTPKHRKVQFLVMESWPSSSRADWYDRTGAPFSTRCDLEPYTTYKRISPQAVDQLFSERYWQEGVPKLGHYPLLKVSGPEWVARNPKEWIKSGTRPILCSIDDQELPEWVRKGLHHIGDRRWNHTRQGFVDNLSTTQCLWRKNKSRKQRKKAARAGQKKLPGADYVD